MNLKPPQTQSHHTLRSTRNWLKIAGKRAKLPDSKQQNYETSKQKTHKQKDMRVKTTVKRCRTTIARLKSMRKTLKTTTKRCKTTRGSKQSKLQKMLNRYRTLKHAHTIQDHSLYGLVALCVCVWNLAETPETKHSKPSVTFYLSETFLQTVLSLQVQFHSFQLLFLQTSTFRNRKWICGSSVLLQLLSSHVELLFKPSSNKPLLPKIPREWHSCMMGD